MMGCSISIEALTVGYGGIPLVREIDIRLKQGEILTLIGPNGAGKTTVLKSIIRQLTPLGGAVCLRGTRLEQFSDGDLARTVSAVLTQRLKTEMMTCREVAATGRYPYTGRFGRLSARDKRAVEEAMELVGVSELADVDFTKISDGQRQRVMLARAISQEPEILVLDEPTSFLDIRYKLEFLSALQQLSREKGLTVIMSLHEIDLAQRISHKIACIRGDKLDRLGSPEEVFTQGYIRELFHVTDGGCEERTGALELPAPKGSPRVFVLGGNGTGIPVYRRLQREGIPFAAGILWENDLDYPVACLLAAEVVHVRAFAGVGEQEMRRARELIERCSWVICTLKKEETGDWYRAELSELLAYSGEVHRDEKGL